jgi:hypothetical protein
MFATPAPRLLTVAARCNLRPEGFDRHNITMFFEEAELPYRLAREAGPTLAR